MKKALQFIFLFLLQLNVAAQSQYSDSLRKELENYTKKDSLLVLKIAHYASSLRQLNPAKAIELYENAIITARELDWLKPIPFFYLAKADIHAKAEKYDAAISNYLAALKVSEGNHDMQPVFEIHFYLSEAYRMMADFEQSALHAQMALETAINARNNEKILSAQFILAGAYANRNMWDSASTLLETTMKMAIEQKNEYMQEQVNSVRADHLIETKKFKEALSLYNANLQFQYRTNNVNGIAWVYSVLAMIYAELNNKDSAYAHADSALAVSIRFNLKKELKDAYDAQFFCRNKFGDYKIALKYRLLYDSIYLANFNLDAGKKAERARMEMLQERKDAEAQVEKLKREAQLKNTRNFLLGILGLFVVIAGFLYWNNRQKQKANNIIEKAYQQLKSTQAQLIQSEKMASLGELTAGIAHEIQNPLNFVNNFSEVSNELLDEMMEEVVKGNYEDVKAIVNDLKQNLQKINHHGKRAEGIVKGMLQHSRTSSGTKELTDLNVLADEYLRLAYHGLRAKDKNFNADFKMDLDSSLPKVEVIPQDIGRVLLNLINNAFQACTNHSTLNPLVIVTTKKLSERIQISVKDNGPGIPSSILDKIFQPFFTTKPTGQGTGLGLSLSYDIVKAHGGELKVDTKEGVGSTFIMELPK